MYCSTPRFEPAQARCASIISTLSATGIPFEGCSIVFRQPERSSHQRGRSRSTRHSAFRQWATGMAKHPCMAARLRKGSLTQPTWRRTSLSWSGDSFAMHSGASFLTSTEAENTLPPIRPKRERQPRGCVSPLPPYADGSVGVAGQDAIKRLPEVGDARELIDSTAMQVLCKLIPASTCKVATPRNRDESGQGPHEGLFHADGQQKCPA